MNFEASILSKTKVPIGVKARAPTTSAEDKDLLSPR